MAENINKLLYLAFGVLLLLVALTSFYSHNQSFVRYNNVYKESKVDKDTWIKEVNQRSVNPLGYNLSDRSLIKKGLVYSGSDLKVQLLAMIKSGNYIIYKDGHEILDEEYITIQNSVLDTDQLLVTFDFKLMTVYIVTI